MRFFKYFISFFTTITTAILFVVAVSTAMNDSKTICRNILFHVLGAGAITAFVTALFFYREIKSRKQYLLITAAHYVVLCVIMIFWGLQFGWISLSFNGIIMMIIDVALVYIITALCSYLLLKKEAEEINRALIERNRDK